MKKNIYILVIIFLGTFPLYALRHVWWSNFITARAAYNTNKTAATRQTLQNAATIIIQGSAKDVARNWKDQANAAIAQIAQDIRAEETRRKPTPAPVTPPALPIPPVEKPKPVIIDQSKPEIPLLPPVPQQKPEREKGFAERQILEQWLDEFEQVAAGDGLQASEITLQKLNTFSNQLNKVVSNYSTVLDRPLDVSLETRIINARTHLEARKKQLEEEKYAREKEQEMQEEERRVLEEAEQRRKKQEAEKAREREFQQAWDALEERVNQPNLLREEIASLEQEAQQLLQTFQKDKAILQPMQDKLDEHKRSLDQMFGKIKDRVESFESIQQLGNVEKFLTNTEEVTTVKTSLEDALAAYQKRIGAEIFNQDETVKKAREILQFIAEAQNPTVKLEQAIARKDRVEAQRALDDYKASRTWWDKVWPGYQNYIAKKQEEIDQLTLPIPPAPSLDRFKINQLITQWYQKVEKEDLTTRSPEELRKLQEDIQGYIDEYKKINNGELPAGVRPPAGEARYKKALAKIDEAFLKKTPVSQPPVLPPVQEETPVEPTKEQPAKTLKEVEQELEGLLEVDPGFDESLRKTTCSAIKAKLVEYQKFQGQNPLVIQAAQTALNKILKCGE